MPNLRHFQFVPYDSSCEHQTGLRVAYEEKRIRPFDGDDIHAYMRDVRHRLNWVYRIWRGFMLVIAFAALIVVVLGIVVFARSIPAESAKGFLHGIILAIVGAVIAGLGGFIDRMNDRWRWIPRRSWQCEQLRVPKDLGEVPEEIGKKLQHLAESVSGPLFLRHYIRGVAIVQMILATSEGPIEHWLFIFGEDSPPREVQL